MFAMGWLQWGIIQILFNKYVLYRIFDTSIENDNAVQRRIQSPIARNLLR